MCGIAKREKILSAMDQPSIDGANTYFAALAAKQAGFKVALSGIGGDEIFGGYPSFSQIPRLVGALRGLPFLRPAGSALRVLSAPVLRRLGKPKWAGLLEYGTEIGDAYLLRRGLFMPWELPDLLGPEEARAGWTALEPLRADLTGCLDPAAPIGVLRRPKMGFVVPWRDWIAGGGRQYPARIWARDVLHALAA